MLLIFVPQVSYTSKLLGQSSSIQYIGALAADEGSSIEQTPDGFALLVNGAINPPFNNEFGCTFVKTNCNGDVMLTKTFALGTACAGFHLSKCENNNFVFLITSSIINQPNTCVVKIDATGKILWTKFLALRSEHMDDIAVDNTGNIFVLANGGYINGLKDNIVLTKLSAAGNVIFQKQYEATMVLRPKAMAWHYNGTLILLAHAAVAGPSFKDVVVLKCDSAGQLLSSTVLGTTYDDEAEELVIDAAGNINIVGRSYFLSSNWDAFITQLSPNLTVNNATFYDRLASDETLRNITTGKNGMVAIGDVGTQNERNIIVAHFDTATALVGTTMFPLSPLYTNYAWDVTSNANGTYTLTGDVRPPTVTRQAAFITFDSSLTTPCYSQSVTLTSTTQQFQQYTLNITTPMAAYTVTDTLTGGGNPLIQKTVECGGAGSCINFDFAQVSDCPTQCFTFSNFSSAPPNTFWYWDFDGADPSFSFQQFPPKVCFNEKRIYKVKLTATTNGIQTVVTHDINTEASCDIVIPNIFTPNNDGVNDLFEIKNLPQDARVVVYNRWGAAVYDFVGNTKFWNGTDINGKRMSEGAYFYIISSNTFKKNYTGTITILD